MQLILQKTIADDSLISVSSLASAFPADPKQALLSYAESGSVVTFLIKEYGRDKMLQFLESFGLGDSSQKALQQVYGFDVEELDARWRSSLGLSPRPSPTARPTLTTTPTPTTDPTVTHTAVATATPTTSPTPKSVGGLFSCSSSSEASSTGSWAWVGVFGLLTGAFLLSWRRRN